MSSIYPESHRDSDFQHWSLHKDPASLWLWDINGLGSISSWIRLGNIFHLLTDFILRFISPVLWKWKGHSEFMYSNSFCSEMSASLSLLESQMDEQDGWWRRALQRMEDKNNLLIHIRMTESLKKKPSAGQRWKRLFPWDCSLWIAQTCLEFSL